MEPTVQPEIAWYASPARTLTDPGQLRPCHACGATVGEPCLPGCDAYGTSPNLTIRPARD